MTSNIKWLVQILLWSSHSNYKKSRHSCWSQIGYLNLCFLIWRWSNCLNSHEFALSITVRTFPWKDCTRFFFLPFKWICCYWCWQTTAYRVNVCAKAACNFLMGCLHLDVKGYFLCLKLLFFSLQIQSQLWS